MNQIQKKPLDQLGYDFIPDNENEYIYRDLQRTRSGSFRPLTAQEIERLVKNQNRADDWNSVLVSNDFNPRLVKNCQFYGLIRIGNLENVFLEYHDLQMPVGLYNSTIISCDIGSNVIINNVRYLAHYIIDDEAILLNIDEMLTTNYAKFGNGVIKDGESSEVRIQIELANENGNRAVLPFEDITAADAFIWSKFRDDHELLRILTDITQKSQDTRRGVYGMVGRRSIIKNSRIIKDVKIGTDVYIKGANKLKNLTIKSSSEAPTQIGEGVELVNGIVGFGARIFYGAKAVRFILGDHSQLKYGARLINSFLGENSTISCCEVLNSLIFPFHEQHHNNSFLCASTLSGQSNLAAGATIGSNHNSRSADGEIFAGRGFWPGLCVSLKHNSKFASFSLIAKGAYPAELNIPLPFSLISNSESENCLNVMPGYWFLYNMYALARNPSKFRSRDKRLDKTITYEYDYLAPDTVNEMLKGRDFLSSLTNADLNTEDPVLSCETLEDSRRQARILKAGSGYRKYTQMIEFYGVRELCRYAAEENITNSESLKDSLQCALSDSWINLGGQLMPRNRWVKIRNQIVAGELSSWNLIHRAYTEVSNDYPLEKARHAWYVLQALNRDPFEKPSRWQQLLHRAEITMTEIEAGTIESRKKDYSNPFRKMTYDNDTEMMAVVGSLEDNDFIQTIRNEKTMILDLLKKNRSLF